MKSKFTRLLTTSELQNLKQYINQFGDGLFCLQQDAMQHAQFARPSDNMNTVIANSGIMFSTVHWRWLTPFEKLAAQGIAVYGHLCPEGLACSFQQPRQVLGLPPRVRSAVSRQAGNAMHCNVIGIAMLWAYANADLSTRTHSQMQVLRQAVDKYPGLCAAAAVSLAVACTPTPLGPTPTSQRASDSNDECRDASTGHVPATLERCAM